jgi:hypothetical protein
MIFSKLLGAGKPLKTEVFEGLPVLNYQSPHIAGLVFTSRLESLGT